MRTIGEMKGARVVREGSGRKVGKVTRAVFHPDEPRLVGFIVKRADLALMIKRADRFLAYDSFSVRDGVLEAAGRRDAWDEAACARLGIDYERCVVWEGMPVATSGGEDLGRVTEVTYDERTGRVLSLTTTDGALSSLLLGRLEHTPEAVLGYRDGRILLDERLMATEESGGAAGAAGEAAAKIAAKTKELAPGAAKAANDLVQKGAYKLGEQLGKTRGMFKGFKEEYDKARRGE